MCLASCENRPQHRSPRHTKHSNRSKLLITATTNFDSNSTKKKQKGPKSFEFISSGIVSKYLTWILGVKIGPLQQLVLSNNKSRATLCVRGNRSHRRASSSNIHPDYCLVVLKNVRQSAVARQFGVQRRRSTSLKPLSSDVGDVLLVRPFWMCLTPYSHCSRFSAGLEAWVVVECNIQ